MGTSTEHTGAMIALVPSDADLAHLAIDEDAAESAEELHLTLFYLGDAADIKSDTREGLITTIRTTVENRELPVVAARAFGVAHWNPESDDPAWVLNVGDGDDGELEVVREMIAEVVLSEADFTAPPQHTPWQPHICLVYSGDDWSADLRKRLGDVTFDRVRLAFGGEVTDVPLGRTATVASSLGGDAVPWHKVRNHTECPADKPWAVVKNDDGDVAGCHASEDDANAQLAALNASESDAHANAAVDCVDCGTDDVHFASVKVSDAPWNGAASRFTDEEYRRAAAACEPGDGTTKESCFLPHHEPDGTLNRNGLHAAAARINQLKGRDAAAVSRARAHLRRHYGQLGEDVPDVLKAEVLDDETFATRVVSGDPVVAAASANDRDDCPDGSRKLPNGECISDEEYAIRAAWHGVLVVEGTTTGDGREFAPDALSWADNALLRWQKEGSHGGDHDVTVSVGRIDEVWRVGNQVMGRGMFDIESVDGFEIARRLGDNFAGGISIDADDIQDADVEFVWADDPDGTDEDDPLLMLFGKPEKVVYHGGRVRAATLCDIPAFVEARIQLGTLDVEDLALAASVAGTRVPPNVVASHRTDISDGAWNHRDFARRLPNVMTVELARSAYAWVTDVTGDRVGKTSCGFLHHEVDESGTVGAANLTACAAQVAALRETNLTDDVKAGIYAHLAAHLRDADQEPPPLDDPSLTAAVTLSDWRPEREWFENPNFSVPTGITVTDEGRVYGHAAQWGECHIGYTDQCITLPREDAHPYFMTGEVVCADGSRVAVGQLTVGTGHAPLSYRASHAAEHYDNTGAAVADVAVGNDKFGIWVAGAVRASVVAARVHELRASGRLSGDWRRIGGQLRLVGLLAVNVPGFPISPPRARVASGAPTALVAAGRTTVGQGTLLVEPSEDDLNRLAMRRVMNVLATRVREPIEVTEGV